MAPIDSLVIKQERQKKYLEDSFVEDDDKSFEDKVSHNNLSILDENMSYTEGRMAL